MSFLRFSGIASAAVQQPEKFVLWFGVGRDPRPATACRRHLKFFHQRKANLLRCQQFSESRMRDLPAAAPRNYHSIPAEDFFQLPDVRHLLGKSGEKRRR
jgi:hypothetical protein